MGTSDFVEFVKVLDQMNHLDDAQFANWTVTTFATRPMIRILILETFFMCAPLLALSAVTHFFCFGSASDTYLHSGSNYALYQHSKTKQWYFQVRMRSSCN